MPTKHAPEIIQVDDVIKRGDVDDVEVIKLKASMWISIGTLAVGVIFLGAALYAQNKELQTWATSLISAIAGAAISYGFNSRKA